jgi:iron complex outermembrane receptor protein
MRARHRSPSAHSLFSLSPLALCASALLAGHGNTLAQAATAETDSVPESTLQTVTVSGQRSFGSHLVQVGAFRDQDPLDAPLTNNVVTREVLDAQGVRTLFGALRNTAGVTRSQLSGSTYDNISIRGILVENRGNYRLNGSLPIVNLIDVPLENKERVEVLKGSSSLYYGLVPPSGVVNFVTKRAGKDPVTSIAVSANEHGAADVHVDVGRRFGVNDSMGLRFNAAAGKEELGIDHYSGERGLASLAYDWRVNSKLGLKFDLEHYRKDVSEQAAIGLTTFEAATRSVVVPPVPSNRLNLAGEWQRYDAEATNALLRADVAITDDWLLTLESGKAVTKRDRRYSSFQFDNPSTLATGDGKLTISFTDGQRFENTNHRVETLGRFETGALRHELTLGATHNQRDGLLGQSASVTVDQNFYTPRTIDPIAPSTWTSNGTSEIIDKGVYAFDRVALGEQWQLLAGARYSAYRNTTVNARGTQIYTANDTSPNVSVLFKPVSNVSVYASYLQGLEETGTAPANRDNAGEVLPPSVNKQAELGVKARLAGSTLLQAALFQIDRPQTTVDGNRFVLGGRSRYRGLELSASGELTRELALVASALLLDAEIVSSTVAAELGKTPENTPKQTYSLFAEYRVPQIAGWAVSAGVYHVGKRMVNNANQAELPGYTTLSIGTRYVTRWHDRQLTLQANVDNATDRDYWSSAGNGLLGAGLPRTVRVAAKVDF